MTAYVELATIVISPSTSKKCGFFIPRLFGLSSTQQVQPETMEHSFQQEISSMQEVPTEPMQNINDATALLDNYSDALIIVAILRVFE